MIFQVEVFWVVTPCSVVVGYQRFRGSCCRHLHGPLERWYPTTTLHGFTTQKTSTLNITSVKASKLVMLLALHYLERLPSLFCCAGNFGKIWSVCGQHEFQYIASGMYKYAYNYIYNFIRVFFCILNTINLYW
jgi:hypothetical protein